MKILGWFTQHEKTKELIPDDAGNPPAHDWGPAMQLVELEDARKEIQLAKEAAYQAGAADAIAKLREGGVELPKRVIEIGVPTYYPELPALVINYGDRRVAAAQVVTPKVNYAPLYEYAKANKVNYNQLCAIVNHAVGIGEPTPEAL